MSGRYGGRRGGGRINPMAQNWWLANVIQPFKWTDANTHAHSGVDKGMPCGSPVSAPSRAKVLAAGPKPWGGQVDLLVQGADMPPGYDQSSQYVLSFLHFSREDVQPGQDVAPGQQIGLSGQPPPGQGFGSGCHVHFEVTHGDVAPYQGQYTPWQPTKTSFPVNGQPYLDYVTANGLITSQPLQTTTLADTSGGNSFWSDFLHGLIGGIPIIGGIVNQSAQASQLGQVFSGAFAWLTNPVRVIKLLAGLGMIFTALFVTFLPDIGAAAVTAAGVPEAAPIVRGALSAHKGPHGVTVSAIRTAGAVQGRKTLARREARGDRTGYARREKERHDKASDAAKRGAQTRKANKAAGAGVPTPKAPPANEAERRARAGGVPVGMSPKEAAARKARIDSMKQQKLRDQGIDPGKKWGDMFRGK